MREIDHYVSDIPLSAVGARRLLKLAEFLDALPRQKFQFSLFFVQGEKPPLEALKAGAHRCGTVGCAIGWMPAVWPKLAKWSVVKDEVWDHEHCAYVVRYKGGIPESRLTGAGGFALAQEVFGIGRYDALFLFNPEWAEDYTTATYETRRRKCPLDGNATPKAVARHLRRFVKTNYRGKATLD